MGADLAVGKHATPLRQPFLDRLKALLTALVVVHHAAITYGASGDWFFRERTADGSTVSLLLTFLCAVNQSFFMGMFFLIAGYFTPGALQRKGPGRFLRERLVRLGVPALVFGLVVGPLTVQLARGADLAQLQWRFAPVESLGFVMGPLWFCWALLLFSFAYVGVHLARVRVVLEAMPATTAWVASALCVGLMAFVVRLAFPVGQSVLGLQLGYFVSYVFLFAIGCMAARSQLLERLSRAQTRPLMWLSLVSLPLLPALLLFTRQMGMPEASYAGGANVHALGYALWEPLVAWGIIASLLVWGRQRLNWYSQSWTQLSDNAYGAFVVHAPVLVLISVVAAPMPVPTLVKFALVAASATVLSFSVSFFLRLSPAVRKVL